MSETLTVMMPRALTAENGAKGLLSGEFYEEIEMVCPECDEDDDIGCDDDCDICNGHATYLQKVPVEWTTIKAIYAMAVKHFGE